METTSAWDLRRTDPTQARAVSAEAYCVALERGDERGCAWGLLTFAFCDVDAADYAPALDQLTEAGRLFAELGDAEGQARVAVLLAVAECRRGHLDAALSGVFTALAHARSLRASGVEAQALMHAGEIYSYRGDLELSLDYLQWALTLAESVVDPHDTSETLLFLSRTYRLLGDYPEALRCGLAALDMKRASRDKLGEAYALNSLGLVHHDPLESAQALAYYLEGLALSERLGNRRSTLALLGNLGELYAEMGDLEKALEYTWQSLALSEAVGSQHTEGISLEGLGILYTRLGDEANVLAYYRRAYELRVRIGDYQGQASTLYHLGDLYRATAQPQKALEHLQRSLALAREVKHPYTEVQVLGSVGQLHVENGKDHEARRCFEEALALAEGMNLLNSVRDLHKALHELHRRTPDFERALAHHEAFHAADKGLSGEVAARRTARLLTQFELERARQEAQIERLRNVELAHANRALRETNRLNAELVERLREQTERLQRQAEEDSLTGLYNRRYAERQLKREFRRAVRYARPLSVALLDIDDFKGINDGFSHAVGDRVLKVVADLLTRSLRPADMAARYGGEEFVLALPETNMEGGYAACEKVRRAVAAYPWRRLHPELRVTLSVGLCNDLGVGSHEAMVAAADACLYRAKGDGKNRVVV